MPRDNNNIGVVRFYHSSDCKMIYPIFRPPVTPATNPKKGAAIGHTLQVILMPICELEELVRSLILTKTNILTNVTCHTHTCQL